jgi:alkanesulfonate monooxygenase SsuD/methylene tetrahydromethanopterin reductase-like flavin-dependent oxidoreductase (luciferase family)
MEFSFYLPCYWPDMKVAARTMYGEMLEQAVAAEQLGYATLAIPEHHFINYLTHPNPLMTAIKVADATKSIPLITAVLVLPFFDMRRLAGEIALADNLTDGRIQLGVGRGAFRYEFDRFGVSVEESREKFDDSLALLEALMTREEVSWQSDWYDFAPLTITPRPLQTPHPPLWIAALSPVAIYHSVMKGYHVMTTPLRDPFAAAKAQAEGFFKAVDELGAAGTGRRLSMLRMLYVARDDEDARDKLEIAHENHRRFCNMFDTPGEVKGGAITPIAVKESVEDMGETLLIGTAEQVVDKLVPYAELGIHDLMLNMSFGAAHRDVMESMARFVRDVAPHVSSIGRRSAAPA